LDQAKSKKSGSGGPPSETASVKSPRDEPVYIKATGKAIEKALNIALFFRQKGDVIMKIKTGSVSAIDDIEVPDDMEDTEAADQIPDAQLRQLSMVEIAFYMR
jgi:ribonuclease P/MRP protein subunit POP7